MGTPSPTAPLSPIPHSSSDDGSLSEQFDAFIADRAQLCHEIIQALSIPHQPPESTQPLSAHQQHIETTQALSTLHQPPESMQPLSTHHQHPESTQPLSSRNQPPESTQPLSSHHQHPESTQPLSAHHQPPESTQPLSSRNQPPESTQPLSSRNQPPESTQPLSSHHQHPESTQPLSAHHQPPESTQPLSSRNQPPESTQPLSSHHQPPESTQPLSSHNQPPESTQPLSSHNQPPESTQPLSIHRQPPESPRRDAKRKLSDRASPSASPPAASPRLAPLADLSRGQWASTHAAKWTCQTAPRKAFAANESVALELDRLAETYKALHGRGQQWKHYAYSKAAKIVRALPFEVTDASQLRGVRGLGESIRTKVGELLRTGRMSRLERLAASEAAGVAAALCKVHGVGAAKADELRRMGVRSVDEAVAAGLLNQQQLTAAKHWRDLQERIPRDEVTAIVRSVRASLDRLLLAEGVPRTHLEQVVEATACGSYRRGKSSSGDVDVLICRRDGGDEKSLLHRLLEQMSADGLTIEHLTEVTATSRSYHGIIKLPDYERFRRLDLKVYPSDQYAYALLYFTGSDHFNRSMRHYAKALGYSLSDHGLVKAVKAGANNVVRGTLNLVPAVEERQIFDALGLEYKEPSDRNCEATTQPPRLTLQSDECEPVLAAPDRTTPAINLSQTTDDLE
ncbi:hypothetical protein AB1Y20_000623 [Prymnesium parvum]|uniref:DNA polymerase n=1 Tax=Prymnesium parvum TaxID=97485 RepID=A0AB34K747_PRYPA